MKTIISSSLLFLLVSLTSWTQKPIAVIDDSLTFGNSSMPGFSVVIPEAKYEIIIKDWIKELQSGTKSKVVEKGDELSIFGAKIKDVSDNPVNVYSQIMDMNNGVNLRVVIELEKDRYIGNAERANARDYLFKFAKEQYLYVANQQLEEEKKKLREFERELTSLKREEERFEKSTKSNTITVAEEKARLSILNDDLRSISDSSMNRTNSVGMGAGDPDLLKDQEKEKKKTDREIKSTDKKINRAEKEIHDNQLSLPENRAQQDLARKRFAEQEVVVRGYEDKVDVIKSYKSK